MQSYIAIIPIKCLWYEIECGGFICSHRYKALSNTAPWTVRVRTCVRVTWKLLHRCDARAQTKNPRGMQIKVKKIHLNVLYVRVSKVTWFVWCKVEQNKIKLRNSAKFNCIISYVTWFWERETYFISHKFY